jgi:hypothetical protein
MCSIMRKLWLICTDIVPNLQSITTAQSLYTYPESRMVEKFKRTKVLASG